MNYKDLSMLSGPSYQLMSFYTTASGGYDIEYICEAMAGTALDAEAWRVYRVRYLTGTQTLVDKMYAIDTLDATRYSYNKGTADFIFPLVNESAIKALTYGISI